MMSTTFPYTRSLRRRFFAYVVDSIAAGAVSTLLVMMLTLVVGDMFRLSGGLINFTQCEDTKIVLDPDGKPASTSGLDRVQVCTNTANFFAQNRTIAITRQTSGEGWATSEFVSFPVDDQNRPVQPIYLDLVTWFVLIIGAAAFEASRLRATPGKLLFGLSVRSVSAEVSAFKATLIRNVLKNFWLFYLILQYFLSLAMLEKNNIFQDGRVQIPANLWNQLTIATLFGAAFCATMIVIVIGLFIPWKTAGRALYDKVADTFVVRDG
jgi:hypothetical protein